jgi:hypothetical protein
LCFAAILLARLGEATPVPGLTTVGSLSEVEPLLWG